MFLSIAFRKAVWGLLGLRVNYRDVTAACFGGNFVESRSGEAYDQPAKLLETIR